jgi:hypothetical protein
LAALVFIIGLIYIANSPTAVNSISGAISNAVNPPPPPAAQLDAGRWHLRVDQQPASQPTPQPIRPVHSPDRSVVWPVDQSGLCRDYVLTWTWRPRADGWCYIDDARYAADAPR